MKKTFLFLVTLMTIGSVVLAADGSDNPSMTVVKSGSTFKLLYKGVTNTDVKVLILDGTNKVVFSERIKNVKGFIRPYNFTNLPEGNYSIEIADNNGRQIEQVSYRNESKEKTARLVPIPGYPEKFVLLIPNQGTDVITIKIYGGANDVLHSKTESITGDFARVYDLNQLDGKVTFVVTDSKGNTKSLYRENW